MKFQVSPNFFSEKVNIFLCISNRAYESLLKFTKFAEKMVFLFDVVVIDL